MGTVARAPHLLTLLRGPAPRRSQTCLVGDCPAHVSTSDELSRITSHHAKDLATVARHKPPDRLDRSERARSLQEAVDRTERT
jgi:serine/threonine protein phosphatase PrpC